ncbi:MAG TPA: arginine deiminase family protein [Acidimicrobiales bacterium]|nr:arginine deiminase family protein [Acidimicrobiales bacterium]
MSPSPPYGAQSMVEPLRRVLVKRPEDAFTDAADWRDYGFLEEPDVAVATAEHRALIEALEAAGAEVEVLPPAVGTGLDSIYTHDPSLVTVRGAVVCSMGKELRAEEAQAHARWYAAAGIPVLGTIEKGGRLEAGDVCWLDERTVAVGEGYRTNAEGIRQLGDILGDLVDEVITVPLPHWHGPSECLHLLSLVSLVDHDLAVVFSPLMPVFFRNALLDRGMELVEVPEDEYDLLGCNVLAVGPRTCLAVEGSPVTRARLEAAGASVTTIPGAQMCRNGFGGPTCLTRPILRTAKP